MSKKNSKEKGLQRGLINSYSGTIEGLELVVTVKGVVYCKKVK
jgi:hypothetical protein